MAAQEESNSQIDLAHLIDRVRALRTNYGAFSDDQTIAEYVARLRRFPSWVVEQAIDEYFRSVGDRCPTVGQLAFKCSELSRQGEVCDWSKHPDYIRNEYNAHILGRTLYYFTGRLWIRTVVCEMEVGLKGVERSDVYGDDPRMTHRFLLSLLIANDPLTMDRPREYRPPWPWKNQAGKIVCWPRLDADDKAHWTRAGVDWEQWEKDRLCEQQLSAANATKLAAILRKG